MKNHEDKSDVPEIEVYTINDLSSVMKKSPKTISSDMVRAPETLPPHFKMPNSRKPLWLKETVDNFIRVQAARAGALPHQLKKA